MSVCSIYNACALYMLQDPNVMDAYCVQKSTRPLKLALKQYMKKFLQADLQCSVLHKLKSHM